MQIMFIPVLYPVVEAAGISPIAFGVTVICNIAVGNLTLKTKALAAFLMAELGITAGMLWLSPVQAEAGTLLTIFCAVLAGIFYTRYMKYKRDGKTKP